MASVDLNSDMGEGFGPWKMGDDAAMLDIVTSANVACGWHAGDPIIMHRTAEIAKAKGVSIGAHPGFGDLWGFGRRVIRGDSMADLEKQVAYQIGAMQACAALAGHKVTHVKAHGALGNMINDDEDMALAIGRAIKAIDPGLVYIVMPGLPTERVAERLGLPMAREVFADRTYDDSGNLTSRKTDGAVIHDAALAAERVLRMVEDQQVITVTGKVLKVKIDTICVHGDNPAAVAMARGVRDRLEAAGIAVKPFKAA
ncbi:LamB/YcsF family protein [Phreatobacter stygius]|uniref:5-oxoprolinase subunit A n=1 Tax=Phreatobacter stygius TaxID=1940610 RepID=A0A4D7B622_9HYPH|nr:5-oxoprolinase subunit PxpA [Phreatobacter stygius]QCI63662.1 LamB/YcsF family protein [Phreatobacter stygius]